jgi:hypothetical protein
MSGRITISALATALLMGTASLALADNGSPAATEPAHQMAGPGSWACGSGVSSAASSGPAAGIGVPNDQTGAETSSAATQTAGAAPSAAASGPAVDTGVPNDVSGSETATAAEPAGSTSTTYGVGRSAAGFDEASLRKALGDQGFAGVTDVRCHNGAWHFRANKDGSPVTARVNPQTGAFESQ